MSALLSIVLILFFLIIIVSIMRSYAVGPWDYEDEVTTTTTTTTTTIVDTPAVAQVAAPVTTGLNINGFPIVGMITRQFEGTTPFVIDPIDGDKVFLNTKDDIYEDGEGKWWGLQ
jgi:hypothetical protein